MVSRVRVSDDITGFGQLLELLGEHGTGESTSIAIAIESDKGLFVTALAATGFRVVPINPRAAARYRERYGQAGGKSDPGRCGAAGQHPAHRPSRAPPFAGRLRPGASGQGDRTSASGGDLGPPASDEPAAIAAAGLLSPSAAGVSEPVPPRSRNGAPRRTHALSRRPLEPAPS